MPTPTLLASSSTHCTSIYFTKLPLLWLLYPIQRKKILKHVSNKEPGRKEAAEDRDNVAMELFSSCKEWEISYQYNAGRYEYPQ